MRRYDDDEPLTVPEVMAWLRYGREKVYALIRSGALASFKDGKYRRVRASAVRAYLASLDDEAA